MNGNQNYQRLILSPHCDDVLLSLGGIILLKGSFKVLSVFSTCAWSVIPGLTDPKQITELNNAEELQAVSKANSLIEFLNINEALLRGYVKWNDKLDKHTDKSLYNNINKSIIKNIQMTKEVFFPLAVGGHVDHRFLFHFLIDHYSDQYLANKKIFLYEDLPYAISSSVATRLKQIRKFFDIEQVSININSAIEKKSSLLSLYKTQLTKDDILAVKMYAKSLKDNQSYHERIWLIRNLI